MKIHIKLIQNTSISNPCHNFSRTNPYPGIYVMDGSWCTATAADREGNKYIVIWDFPENPAKMDWTIPRCILCDGKDVTQNVILDL